MPAVLRQMLLVVVVKGSGLAVPAADSPQPQGAFRPAAGERDGNSILVCFGHRTNSRDVTSLREGRAIEHVRPGGPRGGRGRDRRNLMESPTTYFSISYTSPSIHMLAYDCDHPHHKLLLRACISSQRKFVWPERVPGHSRDSARVRCDPRFARGGHGNGVSESPGFPGPFFLG